MAERVIIVCDVCGATPAEQVVLKLKDRSLVKDLCVTHVAELAKGARAPRRGRRRGSPASAPATAPKRRGRPPKERPPADP